MCLRGLVRAVRVRSAVRASEAGAGGGGGGERAVFVACSRSRLVLAVQLPPVALLPCESPHSPPSPRDACADAKRGRARTQGAGAEAGGGTDAEAASAVWLRVPIAVFAACSESDGAATGAEGAARGANGARTSIAAGGVHCAGTGVADHDRPLDATCVLALLCARRAAVACEGVGGLCLHRTPCLRYSGVVAGVPD